MKNRMNKTSITLFALLCIWANNVTAKHTHMQGIQTSVPTTGVQTSMPQPLPQAQVTTPAKQITTPTQSSAQSATPINDQSNSTINFASVANPTPEEFVTYVNYCLSDPLNDAKKTQWALKVTRDLNTRFETKKGCCATIGSGPAPRSYKLASSTPEMRECMFRLAGRAHELYKDVSGNLSPWDQKERKELLQEPGLTWKDGGLKTLVIHCFRRIGEDDPEKANALVKIYKDSMGGKKDYYQIKGKDIVFVAPGTAQTMPTTSVVTPPPTTVTSAPTNVTPAAVTTPTGTTGSQQTFTYNAEDSKQNLAGMSAIALTDVTFARVWESYKKEQLSPTNKVKNAKPVFADLNKAFENKKGCFATNGGSGANKYQLKNPTPTMIATINDIANVASLEGTQIKGSASGPWGEWKNITATEQKEFLKDAAGSMSSVWTSASIPVLLVHCFRRIAAQPNAARLIKTSYNDLCSPAQPYVVDIFDK